jgi:hypothetical protein
MSVQASTADRMAAKADGPSWLWSLWGVVTVGLAYGLVYTSMRLAISHNLPQDDVTANILAQTLEPGYVVRQPALHEWLLWSVQRLTGLTLLSFLTVLVVPLRLHDLLQAMGPECHKCRVAIPYDGLVAALEARGFQSGTLIASDRHDAGNLRRMFPEARIVCPATARRRSFVEGCRRVAKAEQGPLPAKAEPEFAKIAGNAAVTPERLHIPWQPYPSTSAERVWEWMAIVADPARR